MEGTRIAVSDIAALAEAGRSPAEIQLAYDHLSLSQIHSALAYYYDHKEEIAAERARAEALAEALRDEFPGRVS